jgi:hypothetical protein
MQLLLRIVHQYGPLVWSAATFVLGIASKGVVDDFLKRKQDAQKFSIQKKARFLEQQLSKFYWPIYLHLEKDNLIWERLKERDQNPESPASKLSLQIEKDAILPNHRAAVVTIERYLHLAGDIAIVEDSLRYIRHVKVYEMLRSAGLKDDPISHKEPYPNDLFAMIKERVFALQAEYDSLIGSRPEAVQNLPPHRTLD